MAKQERAIRTRNALINSAAELFDRDGFEGASLVAISARTGVSSGALHFHFASKGDLLDAVIATAGKRLRWITREREGHPLQTLIDATHDLVRRLGWDVVLRAGFRLSSHPERTKAAPEVWGEWQAWVEDMVLRVERTGCLMPGVPPKDLATTVVVVAAGLESLGTTDLSWQERSVLTRFWALMLPRLVGPAAVGPFNPAGWATGHVGGEDP